MDQRLAPSLTERKPPNRRALLQAALSEATARFCTKSTTTPVHTYMRQGFQSIDERLVNWMRDNFALPAR